MKKKKKLTQSLPFKITVFILTVIMIAVSIVSMVSVVAMIDEGVYTKTQDDYIQQTYYEMAESHCECVLERMTSDDEEQTIAVDYCIENDITSIKIKSFNTGKVLWQWTDNRPESQYSDDNFKYYIDYVDLYGIYGDTAVDIEEISAEITLSDMNSEDALSLIDFIYSMRTTTIIVGIIAVMLSIIGVIFLIIASGHRKGFDTVTAGWGTKIPFDLVTAVAVFAMIMGVPFISIMSFEYIIFLPVLVMFGIVESVIVLAWLMSFALRIKLGKWWKNTVIYKLFALVWRALRVILKSLPTMWKATIAIVGTIILEGLLMVLSWNDYGRMFALWIISSVALGGVATYCAIAFLKLKRGGAALANGDLSHQLDTSHLIGDFKQHGEALNSIAYGMSVAINERVKSERMKTELITNVSHDIKTPLTSIINYTDLISKEKCDNEKISEYSEVLLRQSERLKRLIEDLVEASKASTGNLEVNLEPCDVNITITQLVGEYEEKLSEKSLEIITSQPETPVIIRADGRRLWRVFDNLMNNICKYAQGSTRVYLTLERTGTEAIITFKNTSHTQLNISADELMERFVRGDSSRNTEGNGLGLSIAKSLTELQSGVLKLSIDGDLFKVTLSFPIIK